MNRWKLAIDNGSGDIVQLNGENGIMFVDVTGMGAEFDESYGKISDGYFLTTQREGAQQTIAGTLIFKGAQCKEKYKAFADYVLNADKLVFLYKPDGITEYRRDISVKFLSRGGANWNLLQVASSFICLTPWYTVETLTGTGSISVSAGGHLGTSVLIRTTSALTNPVLTMTDVDGEFQRLGLTLTTASGKLLEYSNNPYDSHIYYDSQDAIGYADISKPIFRRSRKAFVIAMSGAAMTAEIRKWWRTV